MIRIVSDCVPCQMKHARRRRSSLGSNCSYCICRRGIKLRHWSFELLSVLVDTCSIWLLSTAPIMKQIAVKRNYYQVFYQVVTIKLPFFANRTNQIGSKDELAQKKNASPHPPQISSECEVLHLLPEAIEPLAPHQTLLPLSSSHHFPPTLPWRVVTEQWLATTTTKNCTFITAT